MIKHHCQLNLTLLMVKGRSDLFLRLELIKKIIVFPILFLAIPYGPMAICWVPFIHMQVDFISVTYYTGKMFNLGYFKQIMDIGKYLVFSILVCIPSFFICLSNLNTWISLSVSIFISMFLYYAFLYRDDNMKEILSIVKSQIQIHKHE